MNGKVFLTPGGFRRLQRRLEDALAAYKAITDDNPAAAESGDSSVWHDNFAFEENQRQMHMLGRQVHDLRRALATCVVVAPAGHVPDRVTFGVRVTYRTPGAVADQMCWIAGWGDGDPATGRVSYDSPLGRALLGAEVGDLRELRVGGTVRSLEVMDITAIAAAEDTCEVA
jgi:transcription elongation factor GreB